MTRQKDEFKPVTEGKINMYACGPTVYNYFHIGNARPFLFFDVVRRYFKYLGYEVTYVQNITDIDGFFKVIDSCKGKVELVTDEGDRLNLKSKLSQYVSLAKIFSDGQIEKIEIVAYEPDDTQKLINFMMNNGG